jgi:hypothetical protein
MGNSALSSAITDNCCSERSDKRTQIDKPL